MKKTISSLLVITLSIAVISCTDERSAERILNDPERMDAVLTAIAKDSSLLAKLHQKIGEDNTSVTGNSSMMRSCMAMMENPEMMNMMMMGENNSTKGKMMGDNDEVIINERDDEKT